MKTIKSIFGSYLLNEDKSLGLSVHEDSKTMYSIFNNKLRIQLDMGNRGNFSDVSWKVENNRLVLFSGELYNYKELIKKLDQQELSPQDISIAHLCFFLYSQYGISFSKHLNGAFSLILYDPDERVLLISVDRFGLTKPIYYMVSNKLYFSSHLKTLLKHSNIKAEIDKNALALFLKYSYIPSPRSIIKDVKKLNPGEMIICKGDSYKIERYIDFNVKPNKMCVTEAVEEYRRLLTDAISCRTEKDGSTKMGILLSGGLDSSANVAIATQLGDRNFSTFGIGFDDPNMDERPYARIVADYYDVPFHDYVFDGSEIEDLPKMIWHLEEPFMENGLFLTYAGFKSAQSRADTIITGNCTDQLFGTGGFSGGMPIALRYMVDKVHMGSFVTRMHNCSRNELFYRDNLLFKIKVMLDRIADFNGWFFWGFDNNQLNKLCSFNIDDHLINNFPNSLGHISTTLADYYQFSLVHQDVEHYACQNVIMKTHRMSEMFGMVTRDPYTDYRLVDFILGLDLSLKRKGGLLDYFHNNTQSKYLHRLAMQKILPQNILNKPKQGGFVNMTLSLNDPKQRKKIFNYIKRSNVISEYMNMKYVHQLLDIYEKTVEIKPYWQHYRDAKANQILYLLTFSLWFDIFVKNKLCEVSSSSLSDFLE